MALEVFQLVFSDLLEMENALRHFYANNKGAEPTQNNESKPKQAPRFSCFARSTRALWTNGFLIRWWLISTCLSRFKTLSTVWTKSTCRLHLRERHKGVKLGNFNRQKTYFRTKGISTKSENPITNVHYNTHNLSKEFTPRKVPLRSSEILLFWSILFWK